MLLKGDEILCLSLKNESMIETLTASADIFALASETVGVDDDFWLARLQNWVEGLPATLQWLGVMALGAIPFIESYGAPVLAMLSGIPWWIAYICGVVGNAIAVAALTYGAGGIRSATTKNSEPKEYSPRQQERRAKIQRNFEKFGVPGVSLLGPLALPSQITAPLMVSFGAKKNSVLLWMMISIVLWGVFAIAVGFGLLALFESMA